MRLKFFDIETWPSWWCIVVSDEEDEYASYLYNFKFTLEEEQKIKDKMRVYTSDGDRNDIEALKLDMSRGCITGYNIKRFDLILLRCILSHFTPLQVYIASQLIIGKDDLGLLNVSGFEVNRIRSFISGWQAKWAGAEAYQDLMDDVFKGLKDKEASFGMDIRETTVEFGKLELTEEEKRDIIFYCKHDVLALHVMYSCLSRPYINTKLALGTIYGLSEKECYQSTNAVLSGKVLGAERVHGTSIKDPTIHIYQDPIRNYIEKWVPEDLYNHLLTSQAKRTTMLFGNEVVTADGGIHSVIDLPKHNRKTSSIYVEACEEYGLYNVDLSGCHPSVMLFCGSMPRGIRRPDRFKETVFRRRALKKIPKSQWTEADRNFVAAGKLIHNTTYGASGNKYLPLYDEYMRSKICRVSQLVILAVTENIVNLVQDCYIIQTNTDGIMLYTKRTNIPRIQEIINEFQDLSNFVFEIEELKRIWQSDVNNYLAEEEDSSIIIKGATYINSIYQPGYYHLRPLSNYVVTKCQNEFLMNGTNPIKMLLEHDVVQDFITTCTKGPTYFGMVQKNPDGDVKLGSVARVIAVTDESLGEVRKQKYVDFNLREDLCALCPDHALVVNDALRNYKIEGSINKREIVHLETGKRYEIDMTYYARQLDNALDRSWYQLYKNKLEFTKRFNL